jgi:hypothetical protein
LPFALHAADANVICFILFPPLIAPVSLCLRHDSQGLVQSFPKERAYIFGGQRWVSAWQWTHHA